MNFSAYWMKYKQYLYLSVCIYWFFFQCMQQVNLLKCFWTNFKNTFRLVFTKHPINKNIISWQPEISVLTCVCLLYTVYVSTQVLWGGRWQNEAAATTGEEVEHINSHFSRLGSCTKHMLPEGTVLLLPCI